MTEIRVEHRPLDVACGLGAAEAGAGAAGWRRLWEGAGLGSAAVPGGVRLRAGVGEVAGDLVRREAACCGFLDCELAAGGSRVRLDITSPAPGAGPVIAGVAGREPGAVPC